MSLADLLGKNPDKYTEVYDEFLYEFETKGLQWAWMMRPEFFNVPEEKRMFAFGFSLPILTYTRINLSKSKEEINLMLEDLKTKYATLPEFQGRPLPSYPTSRDLLDQFFLVFLDDEIEFKINYHQYTLVHQQGLIKDLVFDLHEIVKNQKVRIGAGDMVTVTIKLLKKGLQRREDEANSYFEEGDLYVEEVLTKLLEKNWVSLTQEQQQERLSLFKNSNPTIDNIPYEDVVEKEEFINLLTNQEFSAEQINKLMKPNMRIINLIKMKNWLSRPFGGGTEIDYR